MKIYVCKHHDASLCIHAFSYKFAVRCLSCQVSKYVIEALEVDYEDTFKGYFIIPCLVMKISLLAPVCKSLFVLWFGRHPLEFHCNLMSSFFLCISVST